jgi:hypothetical protein
MDEIKPNYPLDNPLFVVPSFPELTSVPIPRSIDRAPVPGYDMKTLRKQVEYLREVEIPLSLLFNGGLGNFPSYGDTKQTRNSKYRVRELYCSIGAIKRGQFTNDEAVHCCI